MDGRDTEVAMEKRDRTRYDAMKRDLQEGEHAHAEFVSEAPTTAPADPTMVATTGLAGRKVAVLVADGFEQAEFDGPVQALRKAGAQVEVLAPNAQHLGHIRGVRHHEPAEGTKGDRVITEATPDTYDALLVPGGLYSPDAMRLSKAHLAFVKAFAESGKPMAMICHGLWLLADAEVASGRTLTSWPAIRRDLERAGAIWVDQPVVVDGALITSRKPDDVPAFSRALVQALAALAPL
jgi:protease I